MVRLFNLFREGRDDDADELYWQMEPTRALEREIFAKTMIAAGVYSLQVWAYQCQLLGMSGGQMRELKPRSTQRDKDMIRAGIIAAGLKIRVVLPRLGSASLACFPLLGRSRPGGPRVMDGGSTVVGC